MRILLGSFLKKMLDQLGPQKYEVNKFEIHLLHRDPSLSFKISVLTLDGKGVVWKKSDRREPSGPWHFRAMDSYWITGIERASPVIKDCTVIQLGC